MKTISYLCNAIKNNKTMNKTIYIVSYTSYFEEIYNNVIPFTNKEDAIESANNYLDDAKESITKNDCDRDFSDFESGYKEITIKDHYSGNECLISITEFNNIK